MISVCMPTYNGSRYIKEQIESILKQLSPNDELIISDDGSQDATLQIIEAFHDRRIKIYHHRKDVVLHFKKTNPPSLPVACLRSSSWKPPHGDWGQNFTTWEFTA